MKLGILLISLLFILPKINVLNIGGFNAGLRIDDLIIAVFAVLYLYDAFARKFVAVTKFEKWFLLFFSFSLFGTLIGNLVFNRGSLLFPLRMVEYFLFFYMAWRYVQSYKDVRFAINCVFIVNAVVAFAQLTGMVGGWTVYGYRSDVSSRVIGMTGGPWELGVVFNLCCAYYFANLRSDFAKYSIFSIASFLILANGSRMSLLAQVAVLLFFVASGTSASVFRRSVVCVLILCAGIILFEGSGVATRSASLVNSENVTTFFRAMDTVRATEAAPNWDHLGYLAKDGSGLDMSWSMRGNKWSYAIDMWLLNPINTIFGVGMGVFGNALDGGWLRLLCETGIVGVTCYIAMMKKAWSFDLTSKLAAVAISVNMLFIDMHMAYKAMSIMFFIFGSSLKLKRINAKSYL